MKKIIGIIGLLFIALFLFGCTENSTPTGNFALSTNDSNDKVTIYFFWGDGCPHCATQKPVLEELQQKYPEIEVKMFETWYNKENAELFSEVAQAYSTTARGVPMTFIGEEYWVGYTDNTGKEIEEYIKYCIENTCINPGNKLNGGE